MWSVVSDATHVISRYLGLLSEKVSCDLVRPLRRPPSHVLGGKIRLLLAHISTTLWIHDEVESMTVTAFTPIDSYLQNGRWLIGFAIAVHLCFVSTVDLGKRAVLLHWPMTQKWGGGQGVKLHRVRLEIVSHKETLKLKGRKSGAMRAQRNFLRAITQKWLLGVHPTNAYAGNHT